MRFLPIVTRPSIHNQGGPADGFAGPLPTFYMNDYSVLGLRVSDRAAAFKLLKAHRFPVAHQQGCRGITVRNVEEIRRISGLLAENGLNGELADIAEQIYQG